MTFTRTTLALCISLLAASPALATDTKSAHGGRIVEAGSYHVELVAKDGRIDVFLSDHGNKPMSAKGYKGVAIFAVDGKSLRIPLDAADPARLSGSVPGALPGSPKGVIQITDPSGKTVQARFN